jgi:hypothetical protein
MSDVATCAQKATEELNRRDCKLKRICTTNGDYTDADVGELVDCLLARPNGITTLLLYNSRLTDETGVKLARFLADSSTIEWLGLGKNRFGQATFLAIATALQINTSLKNLHLYGNQPEYESRIDAAFIEALHINPTRPADAHWCLYTFDRTCVDFKRLQSKAKKLGHPSLQKLLAARC